MNDKFVIDTLESFCSGVSYCITNKSEGLEKFSSISERIKNIAELYIGNHLNDLESVYIAKLSIQFADMVSIMTYQNNAKKDTAPKLVPLEQYFNNMNTDIKPENDLKVKKITDHGIAFVPSKYDPNNVINSVDDLNAQRPDIPEKLCLISNIQNLVTTFFLLRFINAIFISDRHVLSLLGDDHYVIDVVYGEKSKLAGRYSVELIRNLFSSNEYIIKKLVEDEGFLTTNSQRYNQFFKRFQPDHMFDAFKLKINPFTGALAPRWAFGEDFYSVN